MRPKLDKPSAKRHRFGEDDKDGLPASVTLECSQSIPLEGSITHVADLDKPNVVTETREKPQHDL